MSDLIDRAAAIDAVTEYGSENSIYMSVGELKRRIEALPSAQPYTEAEIQKMQDLEQAELQKAYECGRASAQPERKTGKWILDDEYIDCSACKREKWSRVPYESLVKRFKFCPNCGADMRGEQDETD